MLEIALKYQRLLVEEYRKRVREQNKKYAFTCQMLNEPPEVS